MGLTLVVYPAGRFADLRRFPLNGQKVTLGSGAESLVQIDGPGVRASHASLFCRGGEWFIEGDEECSVGEVPLAQESARVVRIGDPIRVGEVLMELRPGAADGIGEDSTTQDRLLPPPWPTIRVTEGPSVGHVLALREENRMYVVGRGDKADLKLDDRNVSREHIEVERKKEGIIVMDRLSTRGTWLGYTRLVPQRRARWDNRRMVRLGATVLVVDEPAERVAEYTLRAAADAPVSVSRLSATSLSYVDEGRDARAVPQAAPSQPSGSFQLPVVTRSRRPPGPSPIKTVFKVLGILVLAGLIAGVIAIVALLAR